MKGIQYDFLFVLCMPIAKRYGYNFPLKGYRRLVILEFFKGSVNTPFQLNIMFNDQVFGTVKGNHDQCEQQGNETLHAKSGLKIFSVINIANFHCIHYICKK